ncbi:MAG: tetratricopeptide repeat protein [Myxococcales bacterium]|nr:tetratricopeptide repeat protein [Myxococcales bacterium]
MSADRYGTVVADGLEEAWISEADNLEAILSRPSVSTRDRVWAACLHGTPEPTEAQLEEGHRAAQGAGDLALTALLRRAQGRLHRNAGNRALAARLYDEALDLARRSGSDAVQALCLQGPAVLIVSSGAGLQASLAAAEDINAMASRFRYRRLLACWLETQAVEFFEAGLVDEALHNMERALRVARRTRTPDQVSWYLVNMAEFALTAERLEEARRHLQESRAMSRHLSAPPHPLASRTGRRHGSP